MVLSDNCIDKPRDRRQLYNQKYTNIEYNKKSPYEINECIKLLLDDRHIGGNRLQLFNISFHNDQSIPLISH